MANGCPLGGPCGRVENNSAVGTKVKWQDETGSGFKEHYPGPGQAIGGWLHDQIDVDFYLVPGRCTATVFGTGIGEHPVGTRTQPGGRNGTW
jgi:hypothetical protein